MATLSVPTNHATIAAAIAAANPGDTILIEAGYTTAETVTVLDNNLTVNAQTSQTGNIFNLGAGVTSLTTTGPTRVTVNGNTADNTLTSAAAADILSGGDGADTLVSGTGDDSLYGGAGNDRALVGAGITYVDLGAEGDSDIDRLVLNWSLSSGHVTGGFYSTSGGLSEAYGTFYNTDGVNQNTFWYVDEFAVTTGSGNDVFSTGNMNDTVSSGDGNDLVYFRGGDFNANLGAGNADLLNGSIGHETTNITINLEAQVLANDIGGGNFIAGVERLELTTGSGNDSINTLSSLLADSIYGGAGNDTVRFAGGVDWVDLGNEGDSDFDLLVLDWSATTGNVGGGFYSTSGGASESYGSFSNTDANYSLTFWAVDHYNITTGSGNDDITTGNLSDTVSTGLGDDGAHMRIGDFSADLGGGAADWLEANIDHETTDITINLEAQTLAADIGGGNHLAGVERLWLTTGSGNDSIRTLSTDLDDYIATGVGNDTVRVAGGDDTVSMGSADTVDFDRLIVDWSAATGNVTGGFYSTSGGTSEAYGDFLHSTGSYELSFSGVDEFDVTTGSGNDGFGTGNLNDTVSTGLGNDAVYLRTGDFSANLGGDNADLLNADLGAETANITIDLTNQNIATDIGGGNYLQGVERLELTTGSGNDSLKTLSSDLDDNIATGAGNDTVRVAGGDDTVAMGGEGDTDFDLLIVDWSAATGNVTGGYYSTSGGTSETYGDFFHSLGDYELTFSGVDLYNVTTGSGNDVFSTGNLDDTVSSGGGNDLVYFRGGDFNADLGAGNADLLNGSIAHETTNITINLEAQVLADDIGGGNHLAGVERLELTTGLGNDSINTLSSLLNDSISTGAGNDTVRFAGGVDWVDLGNEGDSDFDLLVLDWSATTGNVGGGYYSTSGGTSESYGSFSNTDANYALTFWSVDHYNVATGSGNDDFGTGILNDTVSTGDGNDAVEMRSGDFNADLGAGSADWLRANISAEAGNIVVDLSDQDITTDIGGGNYLQGVERLTLLTGAGNDNINTLSSLLADSIYGGAGNDTVRFAGGVDWVDLGNEGDSDFDLLVLDWSATTGNVGGGFSSTSGGASESYGSFSNTDTNYALTFWSVDHYNVSTGSGDDQFGTGILNDTVSTGAGNDVVELRSGDFSADLGAGNADLLSANIGGESVAIVIDLANQSLAADIGGGNYLEGVERLSLATGSGHDDINTLSSLLNDAVVTGAGNDTVRVAGGVDYVDLGNEGESDLDLLIVDWSATVGNVSGGFSSTSGGPSEAYGNFSNSDAQYYLTFWNTDRFDVTTGSGNDGFTTGSLNDTLRGGTGSDTLYAGSGDDQLWLVGDGNDSAHGGAGSNTLHLDFTGSLVNGTSNAGETFTSAGYGSVVTSGITHLDADLGAGDDSITFNAGNATLNGNAGNDTLTATGGVAVLDGGAGNDSLTSGAGNDTVDGGSGNDTVVSGEGDDQITASGDDSIDAGLGNDTVSLTGNWVDYTITSPTGGTYVLTGNGETVTVTGAELFAFANGTFTAAQILNDAPLAVADSNGADAVVEAGGVANALAGDATATGNVLTNDSDVDSPMGDSLAVTAGVMSGTYGTLNLSADGAWTYTLANGRAATQAMAGGQSYADVFTYTVTDLHGASTTANLTVSISGTNDAAVMTPVLRSTTETDVARTVTGTLSFTDVDSPETYQALAGTAGLYGTLVLAANGTYTYTMDSAHNEFVAGTQYNDAFTVTAADGTTSTLTIRITGSNDAAVMTPVLRTTTETDVARAVTGTLSFTDVDSPTTYQALTGTAGLYGTLVLAANGSYTYTMNGPHNEFVAGTQYNDAFTVTSADGTTSTLTIRITGSNDAAVITGDLVAAVTEDGGVAETDSGTATSTDVDGVANAFKAATGTSTYGSFTVNAAGQWTFVVNNAHASVQALAAAATLADSFQIEAADGTLQTVQVVITGSNDAAVFAGALSGSVSEDAGAGSSTSGTATTTDLDGTANSFTAASGTAAFGSWTVNAAGRWTYVLNNANTTVNNLSTGNTLSDSFTIAAADGTTQVISLTINGANETITGGANADTLVGSGGADLIRGNGGDDTITANAGNDTVIGGAGADSMIGSSGTHDVLSYANGAPTGVVINLATGFADLGDATGDVFSGFEDLIGTVGNDTLTGSTGANVILATTGDDLVEGLGGADTISGGGGIDTLSYANSSGGVTINLETNSAAGGHASGDVISQFENVTGSALNDDIAGEDGNNVLLGGDGQDRLRGKAGLDTLLGEAGGDRLLGGGGNDSLDGGDGSDRLFGDDADDVLLGGLGNDQLYGGNENDSLYGDEGDDKLAGGTGADLLVGGADIDRLSGNGGDDTLLGGTGADVLLGQGGGDRIDGGAGNDVVAGGSDASQDVFVFSVGYGKDKIIDYDQALDRLELDDALWAATPGLTAQQVVTTYGTLNGAGNTLTLTFGTDVLRITDTGGINLATFGSDIIIV